MTGVGGVDSGIPEQRPVKIGASSARALWVAAAIVVAGLAGMIAGSVISPWIGVVLVVGFAILLRLVLHLRGGVANRLVAGLTQLPSPGADSQRANERASQREPSAGQGRMAVGQPGLRETGRFVGVPLTGDWRAFVTALAEAIERHVPAGVSLSEEGQRLVMTAPDEVRDSDLGRILGDGSLDPVDRAVEAARRALVDVQDFVVRATACPWPDHAVAEPGTRALNSLIYLWYGDEDFPVLRLEPIAYSTEERPRRAIT